MVKDKKAVQKNESSELKTEIKSFSFEVPDEIYEKIDEQLEIEKTQERISPAILNKELFSIAPELKGKMRLAVLFSCIGELCAFASYFFGAYAASWLLQLTSGNGRAFSELITYAGITFCFLLAYLILTGVSTAQSHKIAYTMLSKLRIRLFEKLKEIPLGYMAENPIGKIKVQIEERVNDLEDWIAHLMPELPGRSLHPLSAMLILFVCDWRIGLSVFAPFPFIIIGMMIMMHKYRARYMVWMSGYANVAEKSAEYIRGIPVIKAFLQDEKSYKQFSDAVTFYHGSTMDWWKRTWVGMALSRAASMTPLLATLPVALYLYSQGHITIFVLILSIALPLSILPNAVPLINSFELYTVSSTAWSLIRKLLFMEKQERPPADTRAKTDSSKGVEFKSVSFSYITGTSVLEHVNFTANAGEMTAIVGPSGSGKSTIAKLIAGYWDINEGAIFISGANAKDMPFEQLMEEISFVSQDNYLFGTSIRNNIKLGYPNASEEEIINAAKAANCHDFISALPQGYDTDAGDAGSALSGGEKQRIALARAMIKPANIIVLDEATAYADPENEALIQESLSRLVKGKTLIVIAHRLNTIKAADKILVMDKGRIIAQGTDTQLLHTCQVYQRLNLNALQL